MDTLTLQNKLKMIESTNIINRSIVTELEGIIGTECITNQIPLNRISVEGSHLYVDKVIEIVKNELNKTVITKKFELADIRDKTTNILAGLRYIKNNMDNLGNENAMEFLSTSKSHIYNDREELVYIPDLDLIDAIKTYPVIRDVLQIEPDIIFEDNETAYFTSEFCLFIKNIINIQFKVSEGLDYNSLFNYTSSTFTIKDLMDVNLYKEEILKVFNKIELELVIGYEDIKVYALNDDFDHIYTVNRIFFNLIDNLQRVLGDVNGRIFLNAIHPNGYIKKDNSGF